MRALLHIVLTPSSPQTTDKMALLLKDEVCSIGRNVTSPDVLIDDPCASRLHARIAYQPDRAAFVLEDAGSANGTYVNGYTVDKHTLCDQDVIRIGDSLLVFDERRAMDGLRDRAASVAAASLPVLLMGETGTGKEVMARFIHEKSGRRGPFVPVNCGALPRELAAAELFGHTRGAFSGAVQSRPGLFVSANGGTLFLDEIGDLPSDLQPALLRALQEQTVRPVGADKEVPVNVRIVAATNIDLPAAITANHFRADLYARLAQAVFTLPPLRERRFEVPALVRSFARESDERRSVTLAPGALEALMLWNYPYNIRELRALITEFAAVSRSSDTLDLDYLARERPEIARNVAGRSRGPASARKPGTGPGGERERLVLLLESHGGNISAVAKEMGKTRAQIYRWLNRFGLSPRK